METNFSTAEVNLWGNNVGTVVWDSNSAMASFEFNKTFKSRNLDISPIHMPLANPNSMVYSFNNLSKETFKGLPGLLADSLPDKFGNAIIDQWLASQGRLINSFSPIERLCYAGKRSMGALEFEPETTKGLNKSVEVQVNDLVTLAQIITNKRTDLLTDLTDKSPDSILDILRVGTSAGGARAKAVVAWNQTTNKMRSGQVKAPKGYSQWLLKFDGVSDLELGKTTHTGKIEYAYHLMAKEAGIDMSKCQLIEENNRAHFITKRFDRKENNEKVHVQTLCGIAHYDLNPQGSHSYEQLFQIMRKINLDYNQFSQMFRRMVFNVVARNHDDHTKNHAFIMNKKGSWSLSPAYDITHSYKPKSPWTNTHQMTINNKQDLFDQDDLLSVAKISGVKEKLAKQIIEEVTEVVSRWNDFAQQVDLEKSKAIEIEKSHRFNLS